jgi:hypothetical protein
MCIVFCDCHRLQHAENVSLLRQAMSKPQSIALLLLFLFIKRVYRPIADAFDLY